MSPQRVRVYVPATTANLGPGFDALGLALNLWNETEFISTQNGTISLDIQGEGVEKLPRDATNAIAQAALQVYHLAGKPCDGLHIHCINRVPLGSGLGSSSAAMVTGLLGANALLGNPFSNTEILKLAIENEGHPDNVAPAMLGGLVASIIHEDEVISLRLPASARRETIRITVVLPDFDFPTQQARAILPKQIDRKDAIYNISRAVLVTEALRTGDLDLLGKAMTDALHQPYRLPLIPGAQAAMEAARRSGAAAVALSGAGPSLIAFSNGREEAIGMAMKEAFEQAGLHARIFYLRVSERGARVRILD
jgi:homoserine kinase